MQTAQYLSESNNQTQLTEIKQKGSSYAGIIDEKTLKSKII